MSGRITCPWCHGIGTTIVHGDTEDCYLCRADGFLDLGDDSYDDCPLNPQDTPTTPRFDAQAARDAAAETAYPTNRGGHEGLNR